MKRNGLFAAFALAFGLLVGVAIAGEASWVTSFDDAVSTAKKDKKVVLADFTGSDWCGWCIKLRNEVFDTPEFKDWASKKCVLLELDFPKKKEQDAETKKKNKELATKYDVKGFPTIIFFDGDGKEIGRTGYVKGGPKAWIEKAEGVLGAKK
jgi:thioredoxin-related protein